MPRNFTALLALLALALSPASAHALELGVQDDGRSSVEVAQDTSDIGGGWTRTIAYVGQPGVAGRIRDAHHAGLKIILTVGGTGTQSRNPTANQVLDYIRRLPRADRYTAWNEPDLSGIKPCTYIRRWKTIRRQLGTRLLYGDFSPHAPIAYTAAASRCGRLPKHLGVAIHPYQPNDPFKPSSVPAWAEGGLGNLGHARRVFRGMGVRVTWWLDEFGYMADRGDDERVAQLWPRAIARAKQLQAKVLIAYTAKGRSWNTRPGPLTWCALTRGKACPGSVVPGEHRPPVGEDRPAATRHIDQDDFVQMFDYA